MEKLRELFRSHQEQQTVSLSWLRPLSIVTCTWQHHAQQELARNITKTLKAIERTTRNICKRYGSAVVGKREAVSYQTESSDNLKSIAATAARMIR